MRLHGSIKILISLQLVVAELSMLILIRDFRFKNTLTPYIRYLSCTITNLLLLTEVLAFKYTKDHEWVEFDKIKRTAKVGITDYAQKALGDIVFVELPSIGSKVLARGEPVFFCVFIAFRA